MRSTELAHRKGTGTEVPTAPVAAAIDDQRVRMLYANGLRAVPFNILIAIILVIILRDSGARGLAIGWFIALSVLAVARIIHLARARQAFERAPVPKHAERTFALGSTVTGLAWGIGFVVIDPHLDSQYQLLFLWAMGGMAAGAFSSMISHPRAYALFVLAMFVPALVEVLLGRTAFSFAVGVLLVAFVAMLLITHRTATAMLLAGLRDRFEKQGLLDQLQHVSVELTETNERLEQAHLQLHHLATTDDLTQLPNRRSMDEFMFENLERNVREAKIVACIMLDIDHFKQFNDDHGHQAGDLCLQGVSDALAAQLKRPNDRLGRYGGEEFVAVLPGTDLDGASVLAERMRTAVEQVEIAVGARSEPVHVTISAGVACGVPVSDQDMDRLITAADNALYRAKRLGRNRVEADTSTADGR